MGVKCNDRCEGMVARPKLLRLACAATAVWSLASVTAPSVAQAAIGPSAHGSTYVNDDCTWAGVPQTEPGGVCAGRIKLDASSGRLRGRLDAASPRSGTLPGGGEVYADAHIAFARQVAASTATTYEATFRIHKFRSVTRGVYSQTHARVYLSVRHRGCDTCEAFDERILPTNSRKDSIVLSGRMLKSGKERAVPAGIVDVILGFEAAAEGGTGVGFGVTYLLTPCCVRPGLPGRAAFAFAGRWLSVEGP